MNPAAGRSAGSYSTTMAAAMISGAGVLYANVMPLLLTMQSDVFQLSEPEVGLLASALLLGTCGTTAAGLYWLPRVSWRRASIICGVAAAITTVTMTHYFGLHLLLLQSFAVGALSAVPYGIAVRVLADAADKARAYGIKLAVELGSATLILLLLPRLVEPRWGLGGCVSVVASTIAALTICGAALPKDLHDRAAPVMAGIGGQNGGAITVLCAIALYFLGATAMWAYVGRIGKQVGLSLADLGTVLAVAKGCGILGGTTAALTGRRLNPRNGQLLSLIVMAASLALFQVASGMQRFTLAVSLFEYAWTLAFAYQLALLAEVDRRKSLVILAPAAMMIGGSIGPAAVGVLIANFSFVALYALLAVTTVGAFSVTLPLRTAPSSSSSS